MPNPTTINEDHSMTIPEPLVYHIKCNHCHEIIYAINGTATYDLAKVVQDHAVKANCKPHYGRIADSIRNFSTHAAQSAKDHK